MIRLVVPPSAAGAREAGLALVDMSVVEQRYRAVLAVQAGETAGVVAAQFGVSRQSVQNWLRRYRDDGLAGHRERDVRQLVADELRAFRRPL